jgi:autotransporter-associated beta strand protein
MARLKKSVKGMSLIVSASALALCSARPAAAAVYQGITGTGSWNTAANWNPATVPNATGANATFNNDATANNPAQTGNRTITTDGAQTVGSIVFNNNTTVGNTFTNSITTGTGGPLTFDEAGAGPATISVPAVTLGTGNNTISVAMVLTDNVVAQVDNTTATNAAGALNLTAAISGPGGFTKNGDGLMTFGTGAKTYTGPTVINGGRTRMSIAAHPTGNSSFTINTGGQVELISTGTYTFGGNTLNLNGNGATTGPFAAFGGGAIRPTRAVLANITAPVNLQSDTVLHMEAANGTGATANPTGSITFTNTIAGPGKLIFTASNSDIEQGFLILSGTNTYTGGTRVQGGILQVTGTGANLGTGNVTVDNVASPFSIARMEITSGVLDAINDNATLSLAGGGTAGAADQNFAILDPGVNEIVGGLVLGGVTQTQLGTYGSSASAATFKSDEFFSGTGMITLAAVPEPATLSLLGLGAIAICGRRRKQ